MHPTLVGARCQAARHKRGWTLEELAARSGLSVATISRIEHGRDPRTSTALRLARALNVSLDQLVA